MIEVKNLSKFYEYKAVLKNLDFSASHSEGIALMGGNGVGKTTFLKILATLIQPSSGKVVINGYDLKTNGNKVRRYLGVLLDQPVLYGSLSARENLMFYSRLSGVNQPKQGVDKVLLQVGLEKWDMEPVAHFSRGMLQRLSIARLMLHEPIILLLDEPFNNLDQEAGDMLNRFLAHMKNNGAVILMATHNPDNASHIIDRVDLLLNGKILSSKYEAFKTTENHTQAIHQKSIARAYSKDSQIMGLFK
jgi:heme exporter protein A